MNPVPPPGQPDDGEIEELLRRSRGLLDAPEWVIQRALSVWDPRAARVPAAVASAPGALLKRLVAVLTFDSASGPPLAFGQRSAGSGARQLFFAVDSHDIDLRIRPEGAVPPRWELAGQILGPNTQGWVRLIDADGVRQADVALSDLGEFRFPPVEAGQFALNIDLPDLKIVLPPLDLPDVG